MPAAEHSVDPLICGDPTYFFTAYGLLIAAAFPIDELERAEAGAPDLTVRYGAVPRRGPSDGEEGVFEFSPTEAYFEWPGFARFLLNSDFEIAVDLESGFPQALVPLPLLGPVMAIALFRKGFLVLHGSSISIDGQGVMFLGDKGAGKSTTAAALLAAGYDLITDDVVAIDVDANPPRILRAYPSVKLTESASAQFAPSGATALRRPIEDFPKTRYRLANMTPAPSTPAAVAYILERGADMVSLDLDPQVALSAILRFTYLVRFGEQLLNGAVAAHHFRQSAALSKKIAVRRLTVPDSLEKLAHVPSFIAADLGQAS